MISARTFTVLGLAAVVTLSAVPADASVFAVPFPRLADPAPYPYPVPYP
jgi:hypothetical protein